MSLDIEAVKKMTYMCYVSDVDEVFGLIGNEKLTNLLDGVREFFKHLPPDQLNCPLIFFAPVPVAPKNTEADISGFCDNPQRYSPSTLINLRQKIDPNDSVIIQIRDYNSYDIGLAKSTDVVSQLSLCAVVLLNSGGVDKFFIGDRVREMPCLASGAPSNFAAPTITDLEEALDHYRSQAAHVSCSILASVWHGGRDGSRLVFANKPEATMRRSLQQFLTTRLRGDVSVRPEHNTDESKPVDLVVNWFGSRLRALIEIKWLGASISHSRSVGKLDSLTRYQASRAQQGADQLIDYMDREASTDPSVSIRGYLVVFDGRRRNVQSIDGYLTEQDATFFRDKEIEIKEGQFEVRGDTAPLIRYFLEPRSNAFVAG